MALVSGYRLEFLALILQNANAQVQPPKIPINSSLVNFFFFNGLEVSVGWENHKESGVQSNVLSRGEELEC